VVPESPLEPTEHGLVPKRQGWFVLNAREAPWRTLRQWDFVHCPAGTNHVIAGAGSGPCLVLAVGARERSTGPDWGGYTVHEAALRHGAGVEHETTDAEQAYASFLPRQRTRYRQGWLPD
jgi:hypothetical protein